MKFLFLLTSVSPFLYPDDFECPKYPRIISLPNPEDCSTYYECNRGEPTLMHCENGLEFNKERQMCDYPEYANCYDPSKQYFDKEYENIGEDETYEEQYIDKDSDPITTTDPITPTTTITSSTTTRIPTTTILSTTPETSTTSSITTTTIPPTTTISTTLTTTTSSTTAPTTTTTPSTTEEASTTSITLPTITTSQITETFSTTTEITEPGPSDNVPTTYESVTESKPTETSLTAKDETQLINSEMVANPITSDHIENSTTLDVTDYKQTPEISEEHIPTASAPTLGNTDLNQSEKVPTTEASKYNEGKLPNELFTTSEATEFKNIEVTDITEAAKAEPKAESELSESYTSSVELETTTETKISVEDTSKKEEETKSPNTEGTTVKDFSSTSTFVESLYSNKSEENDNSITETQIPESIFTTTETVNDKSPETSEGELNTEMEPLDSYTIPTATESTTEYKISKGIPSSEKERDYITSEKTTSTVVSATTPTTEGSTAEDIEETTESTISKTVSTTTKTTTSITENLENSKGEENTESKLLDSSTSPTITGINKQPQTSEISSITNDIYDLRSTTTKVTEFSETANTTTNAELEPSDYLTSPLEIERNTELVSSEKTTTTELSSTSTTEEDNVSNTSNEELEVITEPEISEEVKPTKSTRKSLFNWFKFNGNRPLSSIINEYKTTTSKPASVWKYGSNGQRDSKSEEENNNQNNSSWNGSSGLLNYIFG